MCYRLSESRPIRDKLCYPIGAVRAQRKKRDTPNRFILRGLIWQGTTFAMLAQCERMHKSAWCLVVAFGGPPDSDFPPARSVFLGWVALAPLLVALLRARQPDTLQLQPECKLLPAKPSQGFLLAYVCGIIWYAGTCYWIYHTMHQYGGVRYAGRAGAALFFSACYLALYHGLFGLLIGLLARGGVGTNPFSRRALVLAPSVGRGGTGPHPHHRISLGSAGHHPGGQYSAGRASRPSPAFTDCRLKSWWSTPPWLPLLVRAKGASAANGIPLLLARPLQ